MNLFSIIKEQSNFGFTGRINILLKSSGQFVAVVFQRDGHLVGAEYGQKNGKEALFKIIFDDTKKPGHFKYVVEPEVISRDQEVFRLNVDDLSSEGVKYFERHNSLTKMKPPAGLRLKISADFISDGEPVGVTEFEILKILTRYSLVKDIYSHTNLLENEATKALISLRKKGALKVLGNK